MMNTRIWIVWVVAISLVAGTASSVWSRGFGGARGGMGGGMRGGMGGMSGGMGGGMRGGMGGGMRGGMGGMPGGMGGGMRGGMGGGMGGGMRGGMGGMPGGMGGMSGGGMRGGGMNPGGFDAAMRGAGSGAVGFPGGGRSGFGNASRVSGGAGEMGEGKMGTEGAPSRGDLGNFLGLPSDGGMHGLAGAGAMRTAGGEGIQARAGELGRYGEGVGAAGRGLGPIDRGAIGDRGDLVRRDFRPGDFYSNGWYRRYPGAWYPARWAYGSVWVAADWATLAGWYGYGSGAGMSYDYGNNVTYQDNSVYINGESAGTADEYYQGIQTQASSGTAEAPADDSSDWMPLGVFAMSHDQQSKANLILQLAINRDGIVRGNYTATMADHNATVKGALDKKTQRVAWTIGDNTTRVFEAGLYDLTKDDVPLLVHYDKDRTEQWHLIRLLENEAAGANPSSPPTK